MKGSSFWTNIGVRALLFWIPIVAVIGAGDHSSWLYHAKDVSLLILLTLSVVQTSVSIGETPEEYTRSITAADTWLALAALIAGASSIPLLGADGQAWVYIVWVVCTLPAALAVKRGWFTRGRSLPELNDRLWLSVVLLGPLMYARGLHWVLALFFSVFTGAEEPPTLAFLVHLSLWSISYCLAAFALVLAANALLRSMYVKSPPSAA